MVSFIHYKYNFYIESFFQKKYICMTTIMDYCLKKRKQKGQETKRY